MVSAMNFTIDEHGFVRSPNLHDGFLDGVQRVSEDAVALSLRDVRGQTFVMELIGAEALVCDDFRLGNIIFDIQIVSGAAPDKDILASLFVPPHPAAAKEFHDQHSEFLQKRIDRVSEGALKLVSIDPSYGCSLRALCTEVKITSSK